MGDASSVKLSKEAGQKAKCVIDGRDSLGKLGRSGGGGEPPFPDGGHGIAEALHGLLDKARPRIPVGMRLVADEVRSQVHMKRHQRGRRLLMWVKTNTVQRSVNGREFTSVQERETKFKRES